MIPAIKNLNWKLSSCWTVQFRQISSLVFTNKNMYHNFYILNIEDQLNRFKIFLNRENWSLGESLITMNQQFSFMNCLNCIYKRVIVM